MPMLEVVSFEICRMYPERFLRHILKMLSKMICFGAFLNLMPQDNSALASGTPAEGSEGTEWSVSLSQAPVCLHLSRTFQIYTFCPDKISNSAFFPSQRHPSLDEK